MKRVLAVVLLAVLATPAGAFEAQTTQAGLAEQAALSSRLHKRLELLGFSGGLYEPLTIPKADAPALLDALALLSPSEGSVPDARGRQAAIAWLAAGAALADLPSAQAANHFFDDRTGKGWHKPGRDLEDGLSDKVREAVGRAGLPEEGMPAPDWVTAKANPFNLDQFLDKYGKAVTAATPGERGRHMAAALIAAGAMLHTLGDLGNPARVRGDYAAMLDPLGGGPDDLGSRFERIAALAYGRLGVPAPARVVTRAHLRDYFTSKDGTGLADVVANTYFSPNTLPKSSRVAEDEAPKLSRPLPALPAKLNLMAAVREDATMRSANSVCMARYRVEHDVLSFSLDDDCMLEQVTAILPEVAAYETGLLDFLFRGELAVAVSPSGISVTAKGLGAGTIDVLVEDDRGVRTSLTSAQTGGGTAELAHVATPATGTRVVAMYRGMDASGEPIVAVGAAPLQQR